MRSDPTCLTLLAVLLLSTGNVFSAEAEQQPPNIESTPGPYTELSHSVAGYEQDITRIETEGGALDARLSEPLTSVGMARMVAGDHAGAAKAFDRALFITRINLGLYSLTQVPLIELQIANSTAWDQPEQLDRNYQRLYWVFRRNYAAYDMQLVPLIEQIAEQRLTAFNHTPTARALGHAVQADSLYDQIVEILDKHPEERAALINALYHRALANYDIAKVADDSSQSTPQIRKAFLESGRGGLDVDDFAARGEVFTDAYIKGTVALKRLLKLTAEDPQDYVAHAEALAYAGDYYYTFRRDWDAMDCYKEAWKTLQDHAAPAEEFQRLFGVATAIEPVAIPGQEAQAPNERKHWVDALADISDSGWPENIRIVATHPENNAELSERGNLAVAAVRHRPRFENGAPVVSKDVSVRYVFRKY